MLHVGGSPAVERRNRVATEFQRAQLDQRADAAINWVVGIQEVSPRRPSKTLHSRMPNPLHKVTYNIGTLAPRAQGFALEATARSRSRRPTCTRTLDRSLFASKQVPGATLVAFYDQPMQYCAIPPIEIPANRQSSESKSPFFLCTKPPGGLS